MAQSETVQLRKPYPLVIGRAECSSNLWGYLRERYGVTPADTVQLVLTEPSRLAEAYRKIVNDKAQGRIQLGKGNG